MSQKTEERTEIGGKKYIMYMLPPTQSFDLMLDFAKMVGPGLGPILDALSQSRKGAAPGADIMDQELSSDFFTKAAKALFTGIDKKVIHDVRQAFADMTEIDGTRLAPIFEKHFHGDMSSLLKWMTWGIRVQWGKSLIDLVGEVGSMNVPGILEKVRA